jgi:hypothetical protein
MGTLGFFHPNWLICFASHFIRPKPDRSMATEAVLFTGSKVT